MTYLRTTLIATAFTAATSTAAFAGGDKNHTDVKVMEKSATMTSPMMDARNTTSTTRVTKANDTIGEVLQADGQPDTQSDNELLTHDGDMLTKREAKVMDSDNMIANNAIVVPSSTGAITTVNCPIGTTAQPDMTCHVTGNYDLEKSESLRKQEVKSDAEVLGAVTFDTQTEWSSEASEWDSQKSDTKYQVTTEYKGTLRPDTVVVSNID